MFARRDKWWVRELARINHDHAAERAAWRDERRELIETVCLLVGKPFTADEPGPEDDEQPLYAADVLQEPDAVTYAGDELLTYDREG